MFRTVSKKLTNWNSSLNVNAAASDRGCDTDLHEVSRKTLTFEPFFIANRLVVIGGMITTYGGPSFFLINELNFARQVSRQIFFH